MSTRLNIALVAEFDLCEKLAEALEQSSLAIEKLSVVELFPFSEEQGIRFNNKSVAQISLEETEWSEFNYVAPMPAQPTSAKHKKVRSKAS